MVSENLQPVSFPPYPSRVPSVDEIRIPSNFPSRNPDFLPPAKVVTFIVSYEKYERENREENTRWTRVDESDRRVMEGTGRRDSNILEPSFPPPTWCSLECNTELPSSVNEREVPYEF